MTPIEAVDVALVQIAGLEVVADLNDQTALVDACQLVLDGLLDVRLHLPLQRISPENGGTSCSDASTSAST